MSQAIAPWRARAAARPTLEPLSWLRTRLAAGLERERSRLTLWLPVAIGAGVLLFFALPHDPPAWAGLAPLLLAAAGAAACWRWLVPRAVLLAVAAAALGVCAGQLAVRRALPPAPLPTRATIVTGTVRGVELLPEGRRITVAEPSLDGAPPLARTVRVRLRARDAVELAAGDQVRVRALLRPPAAPAYPGGRDLQRDAFFSGLAGNGFALNPAERVQAGDPSGPARWWEGVRDRVAARIQAALPGSQGAIAATMLAGAGSAIPEADRAAFRDSGLAHLLAVAGLHVGIVMGLVMAATRVLLALWEHAALRWPTRQLSALAALAAGAFYMLLTGMHLPILRSFAMAALATLGLVLGRRAVSLRGLSLAASVLLLLWPPEVLGVSFQMSFSAVLALISGYEAMRPVFARLHGDGAWHRRTGLHLLALALTSLLAGTASAPFAAAAFGRVQLYFVLANMLAVPLTALWVMPCGVLGLLLMPLGLERLALLPMGWGIAVVLWIGRSVSAWPAAVVLVPPIPPWGLLLVAGGMALLGLLRVRARWLGALPLLLGLLSPALARRPDLLVSADSRLTAVHGEGDGMLMLPRSGASRFTREDWQALWAAPEPVRLPASGTFGDLDCDPAACLLSRAGTRVLLLRPPPPARGHAASAAAPPDPPCAGLSLLVSPEPLHGLCPGVPFIDRFTTWRDGAQAVWLRDGRATVLSDRAARGDRPWVPQAPHPHATPNLPAAAEDDG